MFFYFKKAAALLFLSLAVFSSQVFSKEISVVTTSFPQYDLVRHIVADRAKVIMLLKPGADAHSFAPTPKDLIAVEQSSLFVFNGGENDEWIEELISSHKGDGRFKTFSFVNEVSLLEEETKEGMEQEKDESEIEETEYDEHVFASLRNDEIILDKLCQVLSEISPENKEFFRANADDYKEKFAYLDRKYEELFAKASTRTLIFGDRFPLLYFVRDYGLDYYAAFKGCSSDTEVSASTVRFLIDKARNLHAKAIFKIELTNDAVANTVASAAGAKVMVFNSGHNVTVEQFEKGVSLYDLYESNLDVLNEALN